MYVYTYIYVCILMIEHLVKINVREGGRARKWIVTLETHDSNYE